MVIFLNLAINIYIFYNSKGKDSFFQSNFFLITIPIQQAIQEVYCTAK